MKLTSRNKARIKSSWTIFLRSFSIALGLGAVQFFWARTEFELPQFGSSWATSHSGQFFWARAEPEPFSSRAFLSRARPRATFFITIFTKWNSWPPKISKYPYKLKPSTKIVTYMTKTDYFTPFWQYFTAFWMKYWKNKAKFWPINNSARASHQTELPKLGSVRARAKSYWLTFEPSQNRAIWLIRLGSAWAEPRAGSTHPYLPILGLKHIILS